MHQRYYDEGPVSQTFPENGRPTGKGRQAEKAATERPRIEGSSGAGQIGTVKSADLVACEEGRRGRREKVSDGPAGRMNVRAGLVRRERAAVLVSHVLQIARRPTTLEVNSALWPFMCRRAVIWIRAGWSWSEGELEGDLAADPLPRVCPQRQHLSPLQRCAQLSQHPRMVSATSS